MTGRRVESSDGVVLAVHDLAPSADPDAPTVLFCHATGFHGRIFKPVADALAGFRCFALDLRFHGDTETPDDTPYRWSGVAADVIAAADNVDGAPMLAVGWSLGGGAIVGAAARRPDLFRAAFVFEPILFPLDPANPPVPDGKNPIADTARRRRATFASVDHAYERYASRPPFDAVDLAALRAYVDGGFRPTDDGQVTLKCDPADEAAMFDHWMTNEFERVAHVDMPLTVAASGDGLPPAVGAELVAQTAPHGRFVRFDELTHFGPLEAPTVIADEIRHMAESVGS